MFRKFLSLWAIFFLISDPEFFPSRLSDFIYSFLPLNQLSESWHISGILFWTLSRIFGIFGFSSSFTTEISVFFIIASTLYLFYKYIIDFKISLSPILIFSSVLAFLSAFSCFSLFNIPESINTFLFLLYLYFFTASFREKKHYYSLDIIFLIICVNTSLCLILFPIHLFFVMKTLSDKKKSLIICLIAIISVMATYSNREILYYIYTTILSATGFSTIFHYQSNNFFPISRIYYFFFHDRFFHNIKNFFLIFLPVIPLLSYIIVSKKRLLSDSSSALLFFIMHSFTTLLLCFLFIDMSGSSFFVFLPFLLALLASLLYIYSDLILVKRPLIISSTNILVAIFYIFLLFKPMNIFYSDMIKTPSISYRYSNAELQFMNYPDKFKKNIYISYLHANYEAEKIEILKSSYSLGCSDILVDSILRNFDIHPFSRIIFSELLSISSMTKNKKENFSKFVNFCISHDIKSFIPELIISIPQFGIKSFDKKLTVLYEKIEDNRCIRNLFLDYMNYSRYNNDLSQH